jgi:hypothetical protein
MAVHVGEARKRTVWGHTASEWRETRHRGFAMYV